MRTVVVLALLSGCYASPEPISAPSPHALPTSIIDVDMAQASRVDDMTESPAPSASPAPNAPTSGAALGSTCVASQQCVGNDYGQGRCLISGGVGRCVTAIYFSSINSMNYCLALSPDSCCLSTNIVGTQGTEATGEYAQALTGTPIGGACDFGAFAPWIP